MTLPSPDPAAPPPHADGPRLLADIGGTNARFALETAPGQVVAIEVLPGAAYPGLAEALLAYLALPQVAARLTAPVRHAAIAIANPVAGDEVQMTNHHWSFSIAAVRRAAGLATLVVVNDFTALARALPHLQPAALRQVGGGRAQPGAPLGLIGPGTGLGVSGLIPAGAGWMALESEGGHVSSSPASEDELAILRFAWRTLGHVSAERLLSGPGLELIYRALAGEAAAPLAAAEITARALDGRCAQCAAALGHFCGMLGTVAGNLAVTLGARGGIYLGGGIVPRLGAWFDASPFRARFEAKGRFAGYLAAVPTWVITAPYPAFTGVGAILAERLAY